MFIGLENIDPDNLIAAKKKQNHIADYRELLLEWRKHRCITYCGYIIGFPNDTPESVVRRIEIIKRELPVDILQYSCLTPLPGCEDHRTYYTDEHMKTVIRRAAAGGPRVDTVAFLLVTFWGSAAR